MQAKNFIIGSLKTRKKRQKACFNPDLMFKKGKHKRKIMKIMRHLKHFHLIPGAPVFPRPVRQAVLNTSQTPERQAQTLYAMSRDTHDTIWRYLHKKIVKGTGCKLKGPVDDEQNNCNIKDWECILYKANRKYDGNVAYVTDPLRFRITFDTYSQYKRISEKFLPGKNAQVLEYEPGIRYAMYDKGGFVADQIIMHDMMNGVCFEVQIVHRSHDHINDRTHEEFAKQRAAEERGIELGTHWRTVQKPAEHRRTLNNEACATAQIGNMRYSVSYGIYKPGQIPFAAIWPCAYDQPDLDEPKYLLTPFQASGCLHHNDALEEKVIDLLHQGQTAELAYLEDKSAFLDACQHHISQFHPCAPGRHQSGRHYPGPG